LRTATVTEEVWIDRTKLRREHPFLRIRGKWMERAGFVSGTRVEIKIDGDRLVITKQKEQK
jgi:hypothetical protein